MANISYIRLLQAVELFSKEHMQVKRFASDFPAQMPNFGTESEKYPILFVSPTDAIFNENVTTFTIDVYCFDIIQKDRSNINTILSDTNLILSDLHRWFLDGEIFGLDIREQVITTPIDNALLDYAAGWRMTATFDVDTYTICEIPFINEPVILMEVNDVVYTTTLTCDTLADCDTFTGAIDNLQTQIDEIEGDIIDINNNIDIIENDIININSDLIQPLPAPKIKLFPGVPVEIKICDYYGVGLPYKSFNLYSYPIASNVGLTDKQLQLANEGKILIEMVHYRRRTKGRSINSPYLKNNYSGYVTAGAWFNDGWPSYIPWSQNFYVRNNSAGNIPNPDGLKSDRPNYFQVPNLPNRDIPVYEMLGNRFHIQNVTYRDFDGENNIELIIPTVGFKRVGKNQATNRFAYSPYYTPYYVAFRFIQYIPDKNDPSNNTKGKIIEGPLSNIVKITHKNMPFRYDYNGVFINYEDKSFPICTINDLFQDINMKCWIETKTA